MLQVALFLESHTQK